MLLFIAPTSLGLSGLRAAAPRMAAIPGSPSAADESQYRNDPAAFCRERLGRHGAVFTSGAFGGAVFVGGEAALRAVASAAATVVVDEESLSAPFPRALTSTTDAYLAEFNEECYRGPPPPPPDPPYP